MNFSKTLEQEAYQCLIRLAYHFAQHGATDGTTSVFKVLDGKLTSEYPKDLCIKEWQYGNKLSQWDLYLLDYLLLCDMQEDFKHLAKTIDLFRQNSGADPVRNEVGKALDDFNLSEYKQSAQELRIVSRGAIEHWLPRDESKFPLNIMSQEDELAKRHGFGNLALIDASANSALGKQLPNGKGPEVFKMKNPTMKLLWLAYFSREIGDKFSGQHIECLSQFWSDYLTTYEFSL